MLGRKEPSRKTWSSTNSTSNKFQKKATKQRSNTTSLRLQGSPTTTITNKTK
eukprot:m.28540 g.28540  ORF g.28540 m.28540 type:complete len:52 (+) comp11873_c0_seq2:270-425(+)